jgi:di-heme oxidoreductase (putative peroxidase)
MRTFLTVASLFVLGCALATARMVAGAPMQSSAGGTQDVEVVKADVVATGIPGASAITQVGTFHRGGPFVEKPTLATQAHPVLDHDRLLVASTSNFGAALALPQPEGSFLSIDVTGGRVDITDPAFAAGVSLANRHPGTAGGAVLLYAAQNATFLNSVNGNTSAATASLPSASLPLGISINSGFGRPWFANAPNGSGGDGTITVIDPNGAPLAGAPSPTAGGVFAGTLTNRNMATTHGLIAGAIATALVTKSPDASGRAVFLAALADGSVEQVHVQQGVDGLAPAGSFTPIGGISRDRVESNDPAVVTRTGMLFNWVPTRTVFITDPLADRILAFDLADDGTFFQAVNTRYLTSPTLHTPTDLTPAVREASARNFASNTTLGAGSDFYVLNRGTNSIVRMTQAGEVIAVRQITSDFDGFRLSGLAISEDARTIWLTATATGGQGAVLRTPAFGAGATTTSMLDHAQRAGAKGLDGLGADVFTHDLVPPDPVGPLFNGQSCGSCHNTPTVGGMGVDADTFVTRVALISNVFDPMSGHGGPIARRHSISELGVACGIPTGVPPQANATSLRSAMTLRGTALMDSIVLSDIVAAQAAEPPGVRGRLNVLADGRAGRFGWKAQTATLVEFMGEAFRDEIGITNPIAPRDLVDGCGASNTRPEADALPLTAIVSFLNTIDPPEPASATLTSSGAKLFADIGCASCHKPSYRVLGSTANASGAILTAFLYSDLLLHDMGADLADGFEQGSATGSEFRTAPLWRVSDRQHFLHDGRASTIFEAILAHGGQASGAVVAFKALSDADRQVLLDFLHGI